MSKKSDKMKKILFITIAVFTALSLSACKTESRENASSSLSAAVSSEKSKADEEKVFSDSGESQNHESETSKKENSISEVRSNADSSGASAAQPKTEEKTASKHKNGIIDENSKSTYEYYEELNKNYPVRGEREWKFHSTNPSYKAPNEPDEVSPSDLAECCITVDENDHVTIFWNYYYKASEHPEFSVGGNQSVNFDGVDYYWYLCHRYEGSCFMEQYGAVSIELKCTDDWGDYVNDEIHFMREGTDKLIVTGHSGMAFNLFKGDEFNR